MWKGPKHPRFPLSTISTVRVVAALFVTLASLSGLVTIGVQSSGSTGLMACCIGTAGHSSEACSSGLIASASNPEPENEPEVLCGVQEVVATHKNRDDSDHLSSHRQDTHESQGAMAGIHALNAPCPMECGTCSVSNVRRPRPREQSCLTHAPRPPAALLSRLSREQAPQKRTLNTKWLQLPPRAPPALHA